MRNNDTETAIQILGMLRGIAGDYIGYQQGNQDRKDRQSQFAQQQAERMQRDQDANDKWKCIAAFMKNGLAAAERTNRVRSKCSLGSKNETAKFT